VSVTDIAARIQQIQSQIAALAPSTAAATDGTAFANALAGAHGSLAADATSSGVTTKSAGQAVVAEARKYLGVPYVWGGTDPSRGLDCSGLVQLVYKKFGVELPRVSYQQARAGTAVDGLANARPGDILAFGSPVHHVAIYIGDNKMIEAPRPGKDVRISPVYETPTAIRRVLPDTPVTSAADATGATGAMGATGAAGSVGSGTPYASLFTGAAQRYGVPASLLAAVAHQESGFNASAVSPAGARGLMQLMPATAKGLGVDPMNPMQAVDGAARMLKSLISEFGRVDYALAAYNAGPGAVHRYHGIPPYAETQRYVPAVLAFQNRLAA
jgi:peptidoglycan DL-endopeptidase CwlO